MYSGSKGNIRVFFGSEDEEISGASSSDAAAAFRQLSRGGVTTVLARDVPKSY
jgi:hypothetical protein